MADLFSFETMRTVLEFARHSQAVVALGTGVVMSGATWYFTRQSYKDGMFRTRIEFIGFEPEAQADGTYLVDFPTHGDQENLSAVIGMRLLEKKVSKATKSTMNGFVVLPDPRDHKRMMAILEDHVSGNDPRTNAEALDGVPTRRVEIYFAPTFFYEEAEDMSMIRVFEISQKFIPLLADPLHRKKFKARLARKDDMLQWAIMVAERVDHPDQASSDTAYIWPTTLRASFGGSVPQTRVHAAE